MLLRGKKCIRCKMSIRVRKKRLSPMFNLGSPSLNHSIRKFNEYKLNSFSSYSFISFVTYFPLSQMYHYIRHFLITVWLASLHRYTELKFALYLESCGAKHYQVLTTE